MAVVDIALMGLAALVAALNLIRAAINASAAVVEEITGLIHAVRRLRHAVSSRRPSLLIGASRSTAERDPRGPSEPPRPDRRSTTRHSG
jgi:hypothetical protein